MSVTPIVPLTPDQRKLAEQGLRVVHELARIFARQWSSIPESDFVSIGHAEVVRAAQLYDPKRRTPFEVYVRLALNGVMLVHAKRERYRVQRLTTHLARTLREDPSEHWTTQEVLERPPRTLQDEVADLRAEAADLLAATLSAGTQQLTGDEDGVIDGIDRRDTFVRMRSALAQLAEPERIFVRCYYEEGLSVGDLSRKLGIERRTLFRIQERVREKLAFVLRADAGDVAVQEVRVGTTARAAPRAGRPEKSAPSKRGGSLAQRIARKKSKPKANAEGA